MARIEKSEQTPSRSRQEFLKKRTVKKDLSNSMPSKYVKNMKRLSKILGFDHQNAIVFSVLIGEIKELEERLKARLDDLDNRVDILFSKDESSESTSDSEEEIGEGYHVSSQ